MRSKGEYAAADERLAALPEGRVSLFLGDILRAWACTGGAIRERGIADGCEGPGRPAVRGDLFDLHAALIADAAGAAAGRARYARAAADGERLSLVRCSSWAASSSGPARRKRRAPSTSAIGGACGRP